MNGRGSRMRLLRILMANRPNAMHSVPCVATLCGKLATGNFSYRTDPLRLQILLCKIKTATLSDDCFILAGAVGFEPTTHGFGGHVI